MADLAEWVGALLPTFLISRLMLWLMRSWDGGVRRLIMAHMVALLIATLIGGMGMADGGAFAAAKAFMVFAPPQAVWLTADWLRRRAGKPEVINASLQPPPAA
jgi:hypothetical protein